MGGFVLTRLQIIGKDGAKDEETILRCSEEFTAKLLLLSGIRRNRQFCVDSVEPLVRVPTVKLNRLIEDF